jgi:CelD/BcsL family acetyltransferase involved in cellulose biosynthesis
MRSESIAQIVVEQDLAAFSKFWPCSCSITSARRYPFQCADILDVWYQTIGRIREIVPWFVALLDYDGEPLLLLPLGIEQRKGIRILRFLDGGVSDFNAPVVFVGSRDWNEAIVWNLWQELQRKLPPFDLAFFDKMPEVVEDWPNPLRFLRTATNAEGSYKMTLPADWDSVARQRLPNFADSRRRARKLSKLGGLSFSIAQTKEEAQAFLAAMMEMKSRKFIQTLGYDSFTVEPGYADYYVEATSRLFHVGSIHISALKLESKILAAHWGYVVGEVFYYLMPAFENTLEWSPYAPGRLLNEFLIEWSSKRGLKTFDFGIGDEPYKVPYADSHSKLYDAVLPVTLIGQSFVLYNNARRNALATLRGTKCEAVLKAARRQARKWWHK